jgi:hypothetical protein
MIMNKVTRASFVGLILAFTGGMILTGCSSSEEAPPPEETQEETRCQEGDANYPDCLDANI